MLDVANRFDYGMIPATHVARAFGILPGKMRFLAGLYGSGLSKVQGSRQAGRFLVVGSPVESCEQEMRDYGSGEIKEEQSWPGIITGCQC